MKTAVQHYLDTSATKSPLGPSQVVRIGSQVQLQYPIALPQTGTIISAKHNLFGIPATCKL